MQTSESLESRIVRYNDLIPCKNAFVDSRSPGSDAKENFTIIGPGVSENPNQHVHVPEAHGFNIGGARQPPHCLNSQHSHETAEVFVVHSGEWRFMFGVDASDGDVKLGPGDTISIPTQMFRGFENIGREAGFLFAVLGGDDPGKVTWAPQVFELAREYGLVLLKGGKLIDTTVGEVVPPNAEHERPPSEQEVAALATPDAAKLAGCVARFAELQANPQSPLAKYAQNGVTECAVISPQSTADGFDAGPISGWWPHGFNLRQLTLASGASVTKHHRSEPEVYFVQKGEVQVSVDGLGDAVLSAGDTLTVPVGCARSLNNALSGDCQLFVVRGADNPQPPEFTR